MDILDVNKYSKEVFKVNRQVPVADQTSAMSWVHEHCVIKGKSESQAASEICDEYPSFLEVSFEARKSWIEYALEKHLKIISTFDMATFYDQVLLQHNHIYERLYQFAEENDASELKISVLRQREELLKLISSDIVLFIQREINVSLDTAEHDISKLNESEMIELHQLLIKATDPDYLKLNPV